MGLNVAQNGYEFDTEIVGLSSMQFQSEGNVLHLLLFHSIYAALLHNNCISVHTKLQIKHTHADIPIC